VGGAGDRGGREGAGAGETLSLTGYHPVTRGLMTALWVGAYLRFITFPLLALIGGPTPGGLGFWLDRHWHSGSRGSGWRVCSSA